MTGPFFNRNNLRVNKSLEDVAVLGRDLERAALKAGYAQEIRRVVEAGRSGIKKR